MAAYSKKHAVKVRFLAAALLSGVSTTALAATIPLNTMTQLSDPLLSGYFPFPTRSSLSTDGTAFAILEQNSTNPSQERFILYSNGVFSDFSSQISSDLGINFSSITLRAQPIVAGNGDIFFNWSDGTHLYIAHYSQGQLVTRDVGGLGVSGFLLNSVSADGTVMVGTDNTNINAGHVLESVNAAQATDLRTLTLSSTPQGTAAVNSTPFVSPNGSNIGATVTWFASNFQTLAQFAAIYSNGNWVQLSPLANQNYTGSIARAISDNGIVFGWSYGATGQEATKWVNQTPISLGIPTNYTSSVVYAADAAGDIAVGNATSSTSHVAVYYKGGQVYSLGTLSGDIGSTAQAISGDGSTILGTSYTSSESHIFIYRFTNPAGGVLQNYTNLVSSFYNSASVSTASLTSSSMATGAAASQSCTITRGNNCYNYSVSGVAAGNADGYSTTKTISGQNTYGGSLSFGHRVNSNLTVGGTIMASSSAGQSNYVRVKSGYTVGVWGAYSMPRARGNLNISFGVAHSSIDATINRGLGYTDVQQVSADTKLESSVVTAKVAYSMALKKNWVLTPSLGLTHYDGHQGAYAETGGAFNGSYSAGNYVRNTIDLGITGQHKLNATSNFTLGGGVEVDASYSGASMQLTTDVPGYASISSTSALKNNYARPYVTAAYDKTLSNGATFQAGIRASKAVFGNSTNVGVSAGYSFSF